MANKEATARIRINRLLEDAGWRFFDDAKGPANIVLEPNVKITQFALMILVPISRRPSTGLSISSCLMRTESH